MQTKLTSVLTSLSPAGVSVRPINTACHRGNCARGSCRKLAPRNVTWPQIKTEMWRESRSRHTLQLTQIHCPTHVSQIPPSPPWQAHAHTHTCSNYVADGCTDTNTHSLTFHQNTHHKTHASFHSISLQAPASPHSSAAICANNCCTWTLEWFPEAGPRVYRSLAPKSGSSFYWKDRRASDHFLDCEVTLYLITWGQS